MSSLDQNAYQTVSAPIVDLDTFLQQQRIQKVDFVKCDVEGAELSVLQGGADLFRSPDAPMVLIELNDETSAAFGYTKLDLWRFLKQLGYDHFYRIEPEGLVRQVETADRILPLDLLLACKGDHIRSRMGNRSVAAAA